MLGDVPKWCLVMVASLSLSPGGSADSICSRGSTWWDRETGACVPCTRCDPALRLAVKLPCELHRDTVCHSLYQLNIFPFTTNYKDYYEYEDDSEVIDSVVSEDRWNLQASALSVAASGCVVFFVVVVVLSLYHAKQWRILKQALKSDVKDLSAKLRLMEAGAEPPADRVIPSDHHIYCNIHVTKDRFIGRDTGKKGLSNVYTQEKPS